jgi:DNA repair exonuclease SbcCD nuclease subunit
MAIRLLHSADWQIGKPFSRFAGDVGAVLREARFAAVRRLAEAAREHEVTAVMVAGDILDSEHLDPEHLRRMAAQLQPFIGPWLLLPGNHDPARPGGIWDRFARSGDCPENVHILAGPEPFPLLDGRLQILPAPLTQKHVTSDPSAWFDTAECPAGVHKVGLAHGAVSDRLPEAASSANPIAGDRAERAGLDYLALGDWHAAFEIGPRTWYSGTPEPDDFTRSGIGEALLVTLADPGRAPEIERLRIGRYRWQQKTLELGHGASAEAVADQLQSLLARLAEPGETVLRLTLEGALDLAGMAALAAALEWLEARVRHLECRRDRLTSAASETDLAAFAAEPLLAEVAEALQHSDDAAAPRALRLLHATWRRLDS